MHSLFKKLIHLHHGYGGRLELKSFCKYELYFKLESNLQNNVSII